MAQPGRSLRADAARNRARVLEVAYEVFATEGLSVALDEIARRAGVGPGTVHRHFPAKDDLVRAVVEERLQRLIAEGRALHDDGDPGTALFDFMRSMVLTRGAADRGLSFALAGMGTSVRGVVPEAETDFLDMVDDLLTAAQRAGTVRPDIGARDVKTLLVGCQAMHASDVAAAPRLLDVMFAGMRAPTRD
ncbi:TetR/AcrR family transcriptional regulator [Mycobacterium sp. GA-2829]|uniref:TetR/AcrR family transcriptional regulator n=1 Tax=Mycobacterium sp. GA-2829 TaxID=1772283 RepID=UPI00073FC645|nr:TetR/AcrR family transcriptional regulator [Mycobacterium sp. GA-2829]KUI29292.1 TetR family transcriptional regulator [Mycobacterium sp. GA-2829]